MESSHVPGLVLGLVKDGQVIYAQGHGVAEVGTERPITPESIFQIMDLTHTFTAAAAMQLVEQGKLELDAPVVEYLPYFKLGDDRYTQITLKHLLVETAGLPPTLISRPARDWEGKTPQTDDEALERYVRSLTAVRLVTDPGQLSNFSNMGYDIAGDVIAKVSGEVFEEYMAQHILAPLGMAYSTFYPDQVDPELRVTPHVVKGAAPVVSELPTYSRERAPSVGLFTNLADMLRWTQATLNRGELDGNRILEASSYDQIWASAHPINQGGDMSDRGLGWFTGSSAGHHVCQYESSDLGYLAASYLCPDEQGGAVAMGNQFTAADYTPWYASGLASMAMSTYVLA
jgi:CubicO group peptidase (beta-lactamase class C family)